MSCVHGTILIAEASRKNNVGPPVDFDTAMNIPTRLASTVLKCSLVDMMRALWIAFARPIKC